VYDRACDLVDFEPVLDRVLHFPEGVLDAAVKCIPSEWVGNDSLALQDVIDRLLNRRRRLPDLLRAVIRQHHAVSAESRRS
jgi:hypothetical protein